MFFERGSEEEFVECDEGVCCGVFQGIFKDQCTNVIFTGFSCWDGIEEAEASFGYLLFQTFDDGEDC